MNRRSIREYQDKEIPEDVLAEILEAGRQSPSAANRQPYHFVVVTDPKLKKELGGLLCRFLKKAPVILVGCANPKAILTGKWATVDTTIALESMVLAAWSLGIGSCWVGSFNEQNVKELLKIPDSWNIVALLPLGYPAETPKQRKKKPKDEIFSYNQF